MLLRSAPLASPCLPSGGPDIEPLASWPRKAVTPVCSGHVTKRPIRQQGLMGRPTVMKKPVALPLSTLVLGGVSTLEQCAVLPATQRDYGRRLELLESFCGRNWAEQAERSLLRYFDHLFGEGAPVAVGTKCLAAVLHFRPDLAASLPRCRRALQGWNKRAPNAVRLPVPFAGIAGICMSLVRLGHPLVALCTLLAVDAYLRPKDLLSCTVRQLIRGSAGFGAGYQYPVLYLHPNFRASRSKSNECDEAVVLNSADKGWLYEALFTALSGKGPDEALMPVSHGHWNQLLKQAAALSGIADWGVTAHTLRHVGPSHDFLNHLRSRPEILKRGRWKTDRCMSRYEKSAHMASKLAALPSSTREFLQSSQTSLPAVLGNRASMPAAIRRFLERGQ
eukprot:2067497-Amphidinium_carterae.2